MAFLMQSRHLGSDEFLIECEIRNIKGPLFSQMEQLDKCVANESTEENLVPKRSHVIAIKSPRREVMICNNKLKILHTELQENVTNHSENFDPDIMISRLYHIQGRLQRISNSKTVQAAATKNLNTCVLLLQLVHKIKTTDVPLSESIASLADIEVADNESNSSDGDNESNQSPTGDQANRDKNVLTSSFNDSLGNVKSKFPPMQFQSMYAQVVSVGSSVNEAAKQNLVSNKTPSNVDEEFTPLPSTSARQFPQAQVRFENLINKNEHQSTSGRLQSKTQSFYAPTSQREQKIGSHIYQQYPTSVQNENPIYNPNLELGYQGHSAQQYPVSQPNYVPYSKPSETAQLPSLFYGLEPSYIRSSMPQPFPNQPTTLYTSLGSGEKTRPQTFPRPVLKSSESCYRLTPVHKWGISFDGSASGLAVEKFL